MSDQVPMRKFKSLDGTGKRVYCRGGDIRFKRSEFYETDKPNEINALLRASRVVEVTEKAAVKEAAKEEKQEKAVDPDLGKASTVDGEKDAEKSTQYLTKAELKTEALALGATEEEMKGMNKEELMEFVEAKKQAPAKDAEFEKNKAILEEKGVEVSESMTPEEAAQLVKDMEGV